MDLNNLRRQVGWLWKHRHKNHDDIERRLTIIERREEENASDDVDGPPLDHGLLDGLRDDDHYRYLTGDRHNRLGHRVYYDELLNSTRLTLSGVTVQTTASPTKDADNPLFTAAAEGTDAWDRNKSYASVVRLEDSSSPSGFRWHMFYSGADTDHAQWRTGYASSTDGESFTKPDLFLVSFDGNSKNNILRDGVHNHTVYDETLGLWVSIEEDFSANQITIWTQETPTQAPTAVKTLIPSQINCEGKSIVRRPTDHRWVLYYNSGHAAGDRDVYAFISDTTDLAGGWSEYGKILDAPDLDDQYYSLWPSVVGDQILYTVARYNKTNEQIDTDLFVSRNAVDLTKIADSWVPLGAGGTWDDEMVLASSLVVDDDSWHFYYLGIPEDHTVLNSDRRIGRVTIDRERIGSIGTVGTITTDYMHVGPGSILRVNADASGGTLTIEVQDENGTAITGYTAADFDDITTDSFDHYPTWGQETIPAGTVRLVLTLATAVTVYAIEVTNTVPGSPVAGSPASPSGFTKELVMQDGVTAPPVPLENEARDDWLYQD